VIDWLVQHNFRQVEINAGVNLYLKLSSIGAMGPKLLLLLLLLNKQENNEWCIVKD